MEVAKCGPTWLVAHTSLGLASLPDSAGTQREKASMASQTLGHACTCHGNTPRVATSTALGEEYMHMHTRARARVLCFTHSSSSSASREASARPHVTSDCEYSDVAPPAMELRVRDPTMWPGTSYVAQNLPPPGLAVVDVCVVRSKHTHRIVLRAASGASTGSTTGLSSSGMTSAGMPVVGTEHCGPAG